ncbi:MAG TPA: hypothetical protein VF014_15135, partial [Casimicrobiaceae bacterium]|nr:hypothetical protein [Casimicrobiaceae bacterium]
MHAEGVGPTEIARALTRISLSRAGPLIVRKALQGRCSFVNVSLLQLQAAARLPDGPLSEVT